MSILNIALHVLIGAEVKAPVLTNVIVPDVSFWEDRNDTPQGVDFSKMRSQASGTIIRAGQGSWNDEDFIVNWKAAKGILPRGAYWFYDSRYAPLAQAARFVGLLKDNLPEMEVWLDYEETYNGPFKGWKNFAVFVAEVQRLLPICKIGIYTAYYYWLANSPNPVTEKASLEWFNQFPLWLAWYTSSPEIVKIPKPWTSMLYWQYSAKNSLGTSYGVESAEIDLSYFQGSLDDFKLRYKLDVVVPPTPLTIEQRVGLLENDVKSLKQIAGL